MLCKASSRATAATRSPIGRNVQSDAEDLGIGLVVAVLAPLLISFSNPRLAGMRGVERLQLIAPGFCFGEAFVVLVGGVVGKERKRNNSSNGENEWDNSLSS